MAAKVTKTMEETNSNVTICFVSFCFFIFLCHFCEYETNRKVMVTIKYLLFHNLLVNLHRQQQ